ncbi:MAG: hypothetical protein AB8U25_02985 [Rickettsiales endosymbiont of Dermacentor nuttalli]
MKPVTNNVIKGCKTHYDLQIDNVEHPITTHENLLYIRWQMDIAGASQGHYHCIYVDFKKSG